MEPFELTGKTILITGASSGIGKEAAIMLSGNGASLIITGRNPDRLSQTFSLLKPGNHRSVVADLTESGAIDRFVADMPVMDGIVHCAGIVGPLPVKFITQTEIDRMFQINYHVPVNLTSALLRKKRLNEPSSLLFMSTIATRNPYFGGALYSGAKAALEAYARTLALEMVNRGIRANFLQAGLVDTPMIVSPSENNMQQEALDRYLRRYPLGIGKTSDVGGAILFFMSDMSRWITGTSLILGGE